MNRFYDKQFETLLKTIVKAIAKGIGEDVRNYLTTSKNCTNNAISFLRTDYINTNLRNFIIDNNDNTIELKPFKRFLWTGIIIIDNRHKKTITISSKYTLHRIIRDKVRNNPHYIQSLCAIENQNVEFEKKQIDFGDIYEDFSCHFSTEEYKKDFDNIMENVINENEGYTHYVISYERDGEELINVALILLDKYLHIVREESLTEFIQPDFGALTAPPVDINNKPKKDVHNLVKVKNGIKSNKTMEENKTIEIIPKQEVYKKQEA